MKKQILLALSVVFATLPLHAAAQALPDLTAGATIASSSAPSAGQTVSLVGVITNIGAGVASASAGFPNTFQIVRVDPTSSVQETADSGQTIGIDKASLVLRAALPLISSLAVNASANVSSSYAFDSAGTYAINTCANVNTSWNLNDSISESNGSNNCGPWHMVNVCAANSTWSTTSSACFADVAIADFTSSSPTVPSGGSTYLSWTGVTGGGTVICSISNNVSDIIVPVQIDANGAGSKPFTNLNKATIFTLTCTNGAGADAMKSTTISITVAGGNQPPDIPTISGPDSGPPATAYSFSSTDPEGNNIKYQIDWNNDNVVDEEVPSATTYVPSGTSVSTSTDWQSLGQKKFQVRTVDEGGAMSDWSVYTVTLKCDPHTSWSSADLACIPDVAIGVFVAAPSIDNGQSTPLTGGRITGGGIITCSINHGVGDVPLSDRGVANANSGALTVNTTFTLTCKNSIGPDASKTAAITVSATPGSGICASTHSYCTAGASGNSGGDSNSWTWTCTGTNGTHVSCSENKGAALSAPPSISSGAIVGVLGVAAFSYAVQSSLSSLKGFPFGGFDFFMFPATCSIPSIPPLPVVPMTPCVSGIVPLPPPVPTFFFDFFWGLHGPAVPLTGILAIPMEVPLMFPSYALFPGESALGTEVPTAPTGGFFIPGFVFPSPIGVPMCFESWCLPIAPAVGTVMPFTGTSIF